MHRTFIACILALLHFTAAAHAADRPAATEVLSAPPPDHEQTQIFDEVRFGVLTSIDDANEDGGAFIAATVLFDPWGHEDAIGWDKILRPRIHLGGTTATDSEPNQVYAGFSWTAHLNERFFLELGFGGTLHDGDLNAANGGDGPLLGCRALFREYVAAGLNLTKNWSLIAQMEHSSHAKLCDGPNEGLSRAGVMVGYTF